MALLRSASVCEYLFLPIISLIADFCIRLEDELNNVLDGVSRDAVCTRVVELLNAAVSSL